MIALWLAGCVFELNNPPLVDFAEVECGFDRTFGDVLWTFDAAVLDADGASDVRFVTAEVFDDRTGFFVEAIRLQPVRGSTFWEAVFLERDSLLFCGDLYLIDFVAEDSFGQVDVLTVVL